MTPGLFGRIQTRWFLLAVVGSVVTALVTPLLPGARADVASYTSTFVVLLLVALAGTVWELVYHGFQQFRWEKDWPTLLGLLVGIPEGVVVWWILQTGEVPGAAHVGGGAFVVHFALVWVTTWVCVNGPMRIVSVRWRYNGGRLV